MADKHVATGSFANQGIVHFKKYVKNGVLDEDAVIKGESLNERQIPELKQELEAAGYFKTPEKVVTQPLQPVVAKAKEKKPHSEEAQG